MESLGAVGAASEAARKLARLLEGRAHPNLNLADGEQALENLFIPKAEFGSLSFSPAPR
jgi:hypothetical protein